MEENITSGGGKAVASFVCGIFSLATATLLGFIPVIGLALGIVAIVLAVRYKRSYGKDGMATGGQVLGVVGIVFSVLWSAFIALLIVIGVSSFESANPEAFVREVIDETITRTQPEQEVGNAPDLLKSAEAFLEEACAVSEEKTAAYADYLEKNLIALAQIEEESVTFEDLGIDKIAFASEWLSAIDYEIENSAVLEDKAYVYVDLVHKDELDFLNRVGEKMTAALAEGLGEGAPPEGTRDYTPYGAILQEALAEAGTKEISWNLLYNRQDDSWVPDEESHEDLVDFLYGYRAGNGNTDSEAFQKGDTRQVEAKELGVRYE